MASVVNTHTHTYAHTDIDVAAEEISRNQWHVGQRLACVWLKK